MERLKDLFLPQESAPKDWPRAGFDRPFNRCRRIYIAHIEAEGQQPASPRAAAHEPAPTIAIRMV